MTSKVKIYPNGREKNNPVWLIFGNEADRDRYIEREFRYCEVSESRHLEAKKPDDRARTYKELQEKRVEFAQKNGFKPYGDESSNIWEAV
jgi:hypothetical protein